MKYGRCKEKKVQTQKNKGQEFLSEIRVRNTWCRLCEEAWK